MRAVRYMLVLLVALFTLLGQPAAIASALEAQTPVAAASAEPFSACSDMQHGCTKGCTSCEGAMPSCRASLSCGTAVTVERTPEPACVDGAEASNTPSVLAELHGRSIKPETHPPSLLGQQA